MLKPSILDRYVLREIAGPFAMAVILLTFALVAGRMLKLTEMVVNHGVAVGDVLKLIGYVMPAFLELTFPMAVLLGVLLAFGRMSTDQELTAARAGGISLYRLAVPVVAFAFVVYLVSSYFAFSLRPWANRHLEQRLDAITRTRNTAGLTAKSFNRNFPGMVVYVQSISQRDQSLHGVMIADRRNPARQDTILARRAIIVPNRVQHSVVLRLYDGSIYGRDAQSATTHITSFRVYDFAVRPPPARSETPDPTEMGYGALLTAIRKGRAAGKPDYDAETELAGKYTVPIASLLFALLGVALGLKPARGGQSERFGVSVVLFFVYYSLMRVGQTLGQRGKLNGFVAMAIPDLVFIALSFWLFYRSASDRGDQGRGPGDILWDLIERYERRRQAA